MDIASEHTLHHVLAHNLGGGYEQAVDVFSGKYPIVEEGYWMQANEETKHTHLRVTYEPSGGFVRYNEGTPFEASESLPIEEPLARMESMSRIDTRILEKSASPSAYRREQEAITLRGMIKRLNKTIFATRDSASGPFYGSIARDPKTINGLTTRYNSLTTATSLVDNVRGLGCATANVNSSIWLIKWGPDGVFLLYPKTASKTLQVKDLREQVVYDDSGNPYTAVITNFAMEFGLGVADDRAIQRLGNISTSGATTDFGGSDNTSDQGENAMIDMIERLPGGDPTGCVFYTGPMIMTAIRKRLNTKANMYFTEETVWGRPMLTFNGIPIRRVDALNPFEAVIS